MTTISRLDMIEPSPLQNKENMFGFTSPNLLALPHGCVLNMLETSGSFQQFSSIMVSDCSLNELDNAMLISDETPPGSCLRVLHEVSTSSVSPIGANTTMKVSLIEDENLQSHTTATLPVLYPEPIPRFEHNEGPMWSPGIPSASPVLSGVKRRSRGSLANLFSQNSPPLNAPADNPQQIFKSLQHQRSASVPLPLLAHLPVAASSPPLGPLPLTQRGLAAKAPARPRRARPLSTDERILQEGAEARKRMHAHVERSLRQAAKFSSQRVGEPRQQRVQQSRVMTQPRGPALWTASRAEARKNKTILN